MATIKQQFDTSADTITVTGLNSLSNGATATSNAIDNSSDLFLSADLEITLKSSASETDVVSIYLLGSNDNSTWSTSAAAENEANMLFLGNVKLNGTTAVVRLLRVDKLPKYWKVHFVNDSV